MNNLNWNCKIKNNEIYCKAKLPSDLSKYASGNNDKMNPFMQMFYGNQRPCFIVVYADWCGYCKQLKGNVGLKNWQKVQKQRGKNGVLLINSETDENLIRECGIQNYVKGYPTVLTNMDRNGNLNGKVNQLYEHRDEILKQAVDEAADE